MDIDVSVVVPTYNHENYIRQAIESILMQKINFNMEVWIGEDCSTDNTRDVLKQMEPSLPSNYHIIYREKNLCDGNFDDLYSRITGRYFITLEGDDFWTYEYKLQKEYDFLESHPDYTGVAHNVQVVNEYGEPIKWEYPECHRNEYSIDDLKKGIFPGQTATILRKNYYAFDLFDHDIDIPNYPGDRLKAFLMIANGKVYCIQKKWSAYRLVISHGSSYAANSKRVYDKDLLYYEHLFDYARRNNSKINIKKATEEMYMWFIFTCMLRKRCGITWTSFISKFSDMNFKGMCFIYIFIELLKFPLTKYRYIRRTKLMRSEAIV